MSIKSNIRSDIALLYFLLLVVTVLIANQFRPEVDAATGPPYYEVEYDKADYHDADAYFETFEEHSKALICDEFFHTPQEEFFTRINKGFKNSSLSWAFLDLLWDKCSHNYYE